MSWMPLYDILQGANILLNYSKGELWRAIVKGWLLVVVFFFNLNLYFIEKGF